MNFNWQGFFDLATELSRLADLETDGQKREALRRTAISRAYYAVFCGCAKWIRENFPQNRLPESGEVHRGVIDFFEWHQNPQYREIGALLDSLRKRRNRADYFGQLENSQDLAARASSTPTASSTRCPASNLNSTTQNERGAPFRWRASFSI